MNSVPLVTPISDKGLAELSKIIYGIDRIGVVVKDGKFDGLIVTYFDSLILESGNLIKGTELKRTIIQ